MRKLAALLLVILPALASAQRGPVASLVFEGGIEFGGDEVAEVTFTDGGTQKMYAGQGGSIAFGVLLRPRQDSPLDFRATLGYKFVTTAGDNASITLTRIPMELIATYRVAPDWTVGGGVARHTGIQFNGDGFAPDFSFDDAMGPTIEVAWRGVALSYTAMSYTDEVGNDYNASAIGLSYRFIVNKNAR